MDIIFIEHELAEQDIPYVKLDETTVQVIPHLSQALGGVRLQVASYDVPRALEVLKVAGVAIEDVDRGSPLLEVFDDLTSRLRFIGSFPLGWRFIIVFAGLVTLIGGTMYLAFVPDLSERLVKHDWCVRTFRSKGELTSLATIGSFRMITTDCSERIRFWPGGAVQFPGINTPEVSASWEVIDGRLRIYGADTLWDVYEGEYEVEVDDFKIRLISLSTAITAGRDRTVENLFQGL
ncbi:MAG TPA: hypothetical protein PKN30_10175 [Flavobacteriales bacterium]|nr:hypothetical protein [Flavobacteriales bacterium]